MTFDNTKPQGPRPGAAPHDSGTPANLVTFMLKDWNHDLRERPVPHGHVSAFQRRREAISKLFVNELLILSTGHLKTRNGDEFYPFRAASDFYYLTGNQEPDCVLVLVPEGEAHRATLFVEPNAGKADASFFLDRIKGELWEGARDGVPESVVRYGVPDTRSLAELEVFVKEQVSAHTKLRVLRGYSEKLETWIRRESKEQLELDKQFAAALSEVRLIKDELELEELRGVIDATHRGFEDVIRRMKTANNERELEGVFFTRARVEGNWVGYKPVVAAGAHACTLHWRKNNGAVKGGELLLLDAGVEGNSLYTADITRVLPVSGKFTQEQREIYELVLSAQRAAMAEVKPGNDFMAPNRAAMQVLAHGLEQLGILSTSAEEALREENQFYRRYSVHNVSHMLGLDVHDCALARAEVYKLGPLVPGMVLTVEPGLYMQPDDLTIPKRYRGIGVRIEDDVVVTATGCENLSAKIPTSVDDVERWIETIWAS